MTTTTIVLTTDQAKMAYEAVHAQYMAAVAKPTADLKHLTRDGKRQWQQHCKSLGELRDALKDAAHA